MSKTTRAFYIETEEDITAEEIESKLKSAGTSVETARPATVKEQGYIFTELLISGFWNYETGYDRCEDEDCQSNDSTIRRHKSWDQINTEQKNQFTKRYVQFLENCRSEEFMPSVLIGSDRLFTNIKMDKHQ